MPPNKAVHELYGQVGGCYIHHLSFLQRERGRRLTLAPRSQSAFLICRSHIEQKMKKLPGSYNLKSVLFYRITLLSSLTGAPVITVNSLFLERSCPKNLKTCWYFLESLQERGVDINSPY